MTTDFRTHADATAAAEALDIASERARLVVYYGKGDDARSHVVDIPDGGEVSFGRSRTCTVRIDRERVSRNHARIRRDGPELTLEDLGSRNGTRVGGVRIDGQVTLSSGDEIGIGPATVVVSITSRAARRANVGSTSYLEERLAAEADRGLRYHRKLGLIMMRLEGNDELVDAAVERISANIRPMDVIADYGPDELAVLLPELDQSNCEEVARRLAREARMAHMAELASSPVSVRVGIAVFPTHGTQPGELITRARDALRAARTGVDVIATPPVQSSAEHSNVIIGDPQMERVFALVRKVADTQMTVLVTGETGVGKEVIAEELHRASSRRGKRFIRLNCASIPDTLLESELFGHERGAFTGADRRKIGYFEAADGGTLFLDEIGEISPALQSKLLRVLEEHSFTRVGGTKEIAVDVRVVCATNRDLEAESQRGSFRKDLYFRVSAFTIMVPPLRDRRGEIQLFAEHFAAQAARDLNSEPPRISADAADLLTKYSWPGNVRELRNAMERAVVLHTGGVIEPDHLPDRVRSPETTLGPGATSIAIGAGVDVREKIADVEKAAIEAALEACGGNQTRAAQKLGLSRRALIYKLEKYGLKPPPKKR
jgi:diguanylate cyclase (GGDEF)-like protein